MATASADRTVRVWNTTTGAEDKKFEHVRVLNTVSFSPDGSRLFAIDSLGNFLQWNLKSRQLERAFDAGGLRTTHGIFSGDGSVFVGDEDRGPAVIWESATTRIIGELHHEGIGGLVLAKTPSTFEKNEELVALGLDDGRVIIWDISHAEDIDDLKNKACAGIKEGGGHFSEFETAADPLIEEVWLRGDPMRMVCEN